MLRAGTLRLIFQRVSLLSLLIFRCLRIRSWGSQSGRCTDWRSSEPALAAWRSHNVVWGVGIACGPNCAAVVVEAEFVLQPVSKRALVERHVALEQLEIERDVEAVAATVSSLFPAPMRIRVVFWLPDVSMPWYWSFFLSFYVFQRGRRTSPRCRRSWSLSSLRWRGPGSEPRSGSHLHYSAWFWRPGGRSLERSRRACRGSGIEPEAVDSDQSCSGYWLSRQTAARLWPPGVRGGTFKD